MVIKADTRFSFSGLGFKVDGHHESAGPTIL